MDLSPIERFLQKEDDELLYDADGVSPLLQGITPDSVFFDEVGGSLDAEESRDDVSDPLCDCRFEVSFSSNEDGTVLLHVPVPEES